MGKLSIFVFTTLHGYFEGSNKGDISWHRHAEEEGEFSAEGLMTGNTLLFGRVTYEMMAGYWPSERALQDNPVVAAGMNNADKIVFSRTLKKAEWNNTRLVGDLIGEIKTLKRESGKGLTVLGSGSIVTQLAEEGLIDEYQIMVDPVALGSGALLFKGLKQPLGLKLTTTRVFKSGSVLLCYEPAL